MKVCGGNQPRVNYDISGRSPFGDLTSVSICQARYGSLRENSESVQHREDVIMRLIQLEDIQKPASRNKYDVTVFIESSNLQGAEHYESRLRMPLDHAI